MLMVVVFVFFICNVLALIVNILEVMKIQIVALNNISNLLVGLSFFLTCNFDLTFFLQLTSNKESCHFHQGLGGKS